MNKLIGSAIAMSLMLSAAFTGLAQQSPEKKPGGHMGGGRMMMNDELKAKLKLTKEQDAKAEALRAKYMPKFQAARQSMGENTDRTARMAKMKPIMDAYHKDFRAILTKPQQKIFDDYVKQMHDRMQNHMGHDHGGAKGAPGGADAGHSH